MHHRGIGTVEVAVDRKAVGRSPIVSPVVLYTRLEGITLFPETVYKTDIGTQAITNAIIIAQLLVGVHTHSSKFPTHGIAHKPKFGILKTGSCGIDRCILACIHVGVIVTIDKIGRQAT